MASRNESKIPIRVLGLNDFSVHKAFGIIQVIKILIDKEDA